MEHKQEILQKTQSSVAIEKNSRGITYSVKAYGETVAEIEAKLNTLIELAKNKAEECENGIQK